jgi:hypothetical protein
MRARSVATTRHGPQPLKLFPSGAMIRTSAPAVYERSRKSPERRPAFRATASTGVWPPCKGLAKVFLALALCVGAFAESAHTQRRLARRNRVEGKLDTLTTLVEKGFAAVADYIASIKERMATKVAVAELRLELHIFRTESEGSFRTLRTDLAEINKRLDLRRALRKLKGRDQGDRRGPREVHAIQNIWAWKGISRGCRGEFQIGIVE